MLGYKAIYHWMVHALGHLWYIMEMQEIAYGLQIFHWSSKSMVWQILKDTSECQLSTESIRSFTFSLPHMSTYFHLVGICWWHHLRKWSQQHITVAEVTLGFFSHERFGTPHILPRPWSSQNSLINTSIHWTSFLKPYSNIQHHWIHL